MCFSKTPFFRPRTPVWAIFWSEKIFDKGFDCKGGPKNGPFFEKRDCAQAFLTQLTRTPAQGSPRGGELDARGPARFRGYLGEKRRF